MQVIFSVILQLLDLPLQQGMPFISILQWDVSESFFYSYEDIDNSCANISNITVPPLNDTTRVKSGFKN